MVTSEGWKMSSSRWEEEEEEEPWSDIMPRPLSDSSYTHTTQLILSSNWFKMPSAQA